MSVDTAVTVASALRDAEAVIEQGLRTFVEVGSALIRIRDERLYRDGYGSFEAYCEQRWGMSRPRAYQFMDAAALTQALSPMVDNPTILLPENERQARELVGLAPERAAEILARTAAANDGRLTAPTIRETRAAMERPASPEPVEEGQDADPVIPAGELETLIAAAIQTVAAARAEAAAEAAAEAELNRIGAPLVPQFEAEAPYAQAAIMISYAIERIPLHMDPGDLARNVPAHSAYRLDDIPRAVAWLDALLRARRAAA